MTSMTNEEAFAELYYGKKAIKEVLGITPTCWRPPYGDVDDRIRYIAKQLGLVTVIWQHDVGDGNYPTTTQDQIFANYQDILTAGQNGTYDTEGIIVLSHELTGETMNFSQHFLPEIIDTFKGGVMPVGVCQNWSEIYGEGSGYEYPNYAQWVAGTRSISVVAPTAYSSDVAFVSGSIVTNTATARSTITSLAIKTGSSTASGSASASAKAKTQSGATLGRGPVAGCLVALVVAVAGAAVVLL